MTGGCIRESPTCGVEKKVGKQRDESHDKMLKIYTYKLRTKNVFTIIREGVIFRQDENREQNLS
jgi:hypothetical protein